MERCTFSFEVLTDNGDTAYCNGERISELQVGEDSLMTRWEMNAPIPSYLTNIAVAPYSHFESSFTSTTGEEIPIWLTAQASDLNNVVNSFDNLNNCLDAFESDFGPYRWNRVGYVFVPFGSGAMEHATNIAYPLSLAQGDLTYETLMAHELAHHWWGDLVTCDTQEEMWINEGMASYCESIFLEQVYGDEAYWESVHENHKDVLLYAHIQDGERLPVSGIGHEFTYGDHVYNKGAVIAHNLRQVMGDEDFFEASQSFLEANTYQDVNSIQMRDFFQDFTEMNLTDFFDGWIFQPGFPDYRINNWNSTEVSEGEFLTALSIQQFAHYTNSPLNSAPLEVTLLGNDGEHLDSQILVLDQLTDVNIESTFEPEFVILNRGDELLQAQLSEERIITDAGIETFSRSEFRLNIDELGTDSLWFRVENHWAEATINDGSNGLFISNDRFWRVYSNFPESFNAEARIRFYGNPNSANYFDPKFFAFVEELDLNELNLVLVHRPFNSAGWAEVPFELNAQGDEENFQGMINFPLSESGDYAWAIATDQINVEENELSTLQVFPNPSSTSIQVKLNAKTGYTILSLAGK
ncbi:MAG: M1 family aminopeptidase, partial [Flavobacteriales bacterium]